MEAKSSHMCISQVPLPFRPGAWKAAVGARERQEDSSKILRDAVGEQARSGRQQQQGCRIPSPRALEATSPWITAQTMLVAKQRSGKQHGTRAAESVHHNFAACVQAHSSRTPWRTAHAQHPRPPIPPLSLSLSPSSAHSLLLSSSASLFLSLSPSHTRRGHIRGGNGSSWIWRRSSCLAMRAQRRLRAKVLLPPSALEMASHRTPHCSLLPGQRNDSDDRGNRQECSRSHHRADARSDGPLSSPRRSNAPVAAHDVGDSWETAFHKPPRLP